MRKTTLQDVADAAGISVAAVSMILSGKGKISAAMAERVRALASELGYVRKQSREGTAGRDFKYVAILQQEFVPYLWNFSIPFTLRLDEVVVQHGKNPIVLHVPVHYTNRMLFKEIVGAKVGAVFSLHYVECDLFTDLEAAGIPVIIINNNEYQNRFCSVLSDNLQASYEATRHVIELCHRRIGYADYKRPQYAALVADRFYGYRRALAENNLEYDDAYMISVEIDDYPALLARVRSIYDNAVAPTAWVVHDDFFAACLMEALKSIGRRVPADVSVIAAGGDVLDYSLPFIPKITTLQGDQKLMASMAWSLLESRLKSPSSAVQVLKTKMPLVDRGSCRFDME
jgi:DNA-binding LacI/PurR family transcriptional regulator